MKKQLYIIRGTGLNLDGSVVEVIGEQGDYLVVSPPNTKVETQTTMVKRACVQPIPDRTVTYNINISKTVWGSEKEIHGPINISLDNCLRDVSINTIAEFITNNLKPILRME